jgi:hypothetical protein
MAEFKMTEARARVLHEIVYGNSVHKEMYGKRSYGCNPQGSGATTDITRIIAPLERASLIKLVPNHNRWRLGWAATPAGLAALAEFDKGTGSV